MKLAQVEQITFILTFFLLISTSSIAYIKTWESKNDTKLQASYKWSATICLIASLSYYLILTDASSVTLSDLRSIDWLVTCPLLLIEMGLLLGVGPKNYTVIRAALASMLMIIFGWGGAPSAAWLIVSFVLLAYITQQLQILYKSSRSKHRRIVPLFFAFWFFYGLIAVLRLVSPDFFSNSLVNIGYNTLDAVTKAGMGLLVILIDY